MTGYLSAILGRLGFWGLLALILAGLIASVVLSPLVILAAVLVFGASLIAVVARIRQRRSVLRWGGVAVFSLFLALAFSGISNILYDRSFGLFGGSDYSVVYSESSFAEIPTLELAVLSDSDDEEGLRIIAEDIIKDEDLGNADVVSVSVFDPDTTIQGEDNLWPGVKPKDPDADPFDLDSNGVATINLSADGYETFRGGSLPRGYYQVLHSEDILDCNLADTDCQAQVIYDHVEQYPIPDQ